MSTAADGRRARGRRSDNGPVLLSELVEQLMACLRKPPTDVLSAVFKDWPAVVGADVARHCRPVAVDANRLVVEADDPVWAGEVKWHSEAVLERIAGMSGKRRIGELVVRVGYHRPEAGARMGGGTRGAAPASPDTGAWHPDPDRSEPAEGGGPQRPVIRGCHP